MLDHARTRFFFALLALTILGAGIVILHPRPLLKSDRTRLLEVLLAHWRQERIATIPSPLPGLIPPRRRYRSLRTPARSTAWVSPRVLRHWSHRLSAVGSSVLV